ncbi:DUF2510 domain-containing protein [Streptomyces mangrovisoli]|uniref:DUF2510 domain-containing protein n=1 Tax=Streptomyces mangrovisoli TaxID=1428628 RepID=A0A1J4NV64_9ACTN|nr:DUF2510 domain-containing protein [Streptomyces mangrovisoli]OIJ66351.1 hypothetical protein WN71_018720 [Streptomyces mangrovisoli]
MTQVTPPGWYPDPGQSDDSPATERWWDGKAWTDQTRPAGSTSVWGPPTQPPAAGGFPAYPAYPAQPPAGSRRGLRTGIAVGVAAAVLAAIGVGAWALTDNGGGNGNGNQAGTQQGPGGFGGGQGGPEGGFGGGQGGPFGQNGGGEDGGQSGGSGDGGSGGQSPDPGQSEAPKVKGGGTVSDSINAISVPVPDGWTGESITVGAQVTSDDSYKCPGDTSQTCTKGGAYSAPAAALGTKGDTAEAVAKADISANAEESYGKGYGSITSHKVLESKAITVAGQKGYLVRWKAVTSKGADGIVESLVFPSPASASQLVVVRFGIDADQKASVIDTITKGIAASSGGGDGQKV